MKKIDERRQKKDAMKNKEHIDFLMIKAPWRLHKVKYPLEGEEINDQKLYSEQIHEWKPCHPLKKFHVIIHYKSQSSIIVNFHVPSHGHMEVMM